VRGRWNWIRFVGPNRVRSFWWGVGWLQDLLFWPTCKTRGYGRWEVSLANDTGGFSGSYCMYSIYTVHHRSQACPTLWPFGLSEVSLRLFPTCAPMWNVRGECIPHLRSHVECLCPTCASTRLRLYCFPYDGQGDAMHNKVWENILQHYLILL